MTVSSILLLVFFLIIFAVGMRLAGKAQKKAQQKPAQPVPPPAKGFASDVQCLSMRGAAGLGTLAVTGYVAASTINRMQNGETTQQQAPPALDVANKMHQDSAESNASGIELDENLTSGNDLNSFSDGFLDSFDDLW